jgi:hypothetical protein
MWVVVIAGSSGYFVPRIVSKFWCVCDGQVDALLLYRAVMVEKHPAAIRAWDR